MIIIVFYLQEFTAMTLVIYSQVLIIYIKNTLTETWKRAVSYWVSSPLRTK